MSVREGKKKRSPNWTDKEVNVLLDIWKQYKKQLESSKRNHTLYQEMSTEMAGYYCYRTAEEIRTKIDNMSKRFKYERTQEILNDSRSEWRFYWQVDDILGLNPVYCIEYIKDNINKKSEERAKEENQATILMLKYPNKEEIDNEIEENDKQAEFMDHDQDQSQEHEEPLNIRFQSPLPAVDASDETDLPNEKFFKEVLEEYRETKESLVETDKKIIELLTNQNDLIKTQNELCQTQNEILKTLLEKMM